MVMTRPPGVFMERGPGRAPPLGLLTSGVPVFLGLAERGPTSQPVRITSTAEFHEVFGHLDVGSHLAPSIDGFFLNGGRECYVVRIAHLFDRRPDEMLSSPRGALRGPRDFAIKASRRLRDGDGQQTLLVQALSEGMWGNDVRVSVQRPEAQVQTFVTVDCQPGDTGVMVKSTYGFQRGTLVKIHDRDKAAYRVLTAVDGRTLYWAEKEGLDDEFLSSSPTLIEPVGFDLVAETHNSREVFRGLNLSRQSPWYAERMVNGTSRLITVTNLDSASGVPSHFPAEVSASQLEGGTDGLYTVAPEDFIGADFGPGHRYGLAGVAELEAVDLIVLPDLPWCLQRSSGFSSPKDMEVVQQEVVTQCESKRDRFAILDFPPETTPTGAMQWRRLFDSSYAAFYYPYLMPSTGSGGKPMPPSGHVAGIYARCDREQGVYRAPANEPFEGVVDLEWFLQPADIGSLNAEGINCLQIFAQRGIRVWGARTAASDPILRFINVRRTIAAIARALHTGLQWVVFENNGPELWSTVARDVSFFLEKLWRSGYLSGASAEEAFFVKCDEELNSPEILKKGQMIVDVGLAPFRPAEFVGVRVVQELDVLAREDGA